jgi:hypothetical protein
LTIILSKEYATEWHKLSNPLILMKSKKVKKCRFLSFRRTSDQVQSRYPNPGVSRNSGPLRPCPGESQGRGDGLEAFLLVHQRLGELSDLEKTVNFLFKPFLTEWIPLIQGVILLGGLYFGLTRGYVAIKPVVDDPHSRAKAMIPLSLFILLVVNILAKLYMG